MKLAEALIPEFEQEAATTRKTLERIPDGKMEWQPHTKSMSLGRLAHHVAEIPGWTTMTFDRDVLDMGDYKPPQVQTRAEILAMFDKNVADARKALAEVSDEIAQGNWSLTGGGQTYFTMPKMAVIRTWVLNHSVHHRAQLGVYLRLLDIPVPGVYGPSADEM
ncbi:MAG: DinB family protein [Acidobacteriota bacterium]|nr:DinB family protein [Acidobacteriota bacterium]